MLSYLTQRISGWKKPKKLVVIMIKYKQKLLKIIRHKRQYKIEAHTSEESYQDFSMLQKAETEIMKMCQTRNFWKEIETENARKRVPSTSSINQLDPFLDKDGVLRVGKRLVKSIWVMSWSIQFGYQTLHHITVNHQVLLWEHSTLRKRDGH